MSDLRSALRGLVGGVAAVGLCLLAVGPVSAQSPSPSNLPDPASQAPSPAPSVAPDPQPDGTWQVGAFDAWGEGLIEPRRDSQLTVSLLPGGRLEGTTACGTYVGGYTLEGERLAMRVISKGPDPCAGGRLDEAVAFSLALSAVASWAPTASGLELLDEAGLVRVVLARPDGLGLTGEWLVAGYARSNGRFIEPLAGADLAMVFDEDGSVRGSTGCRLFEARYSTEARRLSIGAVDTVGLPCEGDRRRQERRFLRAVSEVVLWQRDGATLLLQDGDEGLLIELVAQGEGAAPGAAAAPGPAASPDAAEPPTQTASPTAAGS